MEWTVGEGDALLVVDVQNDFLPGGSQPVPDGDAVVGPIKHYIDLFAKTGKPVYFTRDWHPEDHCSFAAQGGPWSPHCVQGTDGAALCPDISMPPGAVLISKAKAASDDIYSGFRNTDLNDQLHADGSVRLFVCGLATEYAVLQTVQDALERDFQVRLLTDAVRAVNLAPDDGARAEEKMLALGAIPATLNGFRE
ncbi:MAG: isochorismatase family protein [Leptospirillia bacterium]